MSLIGTPSQSSPFFSNKKWAVYGDLWSSPTEGWLRRVLDEYRAPPAILFRTPDLFSIFVLRDGAWREYASLHDNGRPGSFRSFRYMLGRLVPNSKSVPLRLSTDFVTCKRFNVQASSVRELNREVRKQLSNHCPWPLEETWCGFVPLEPPKRGKPTPVVAAFAQKGRMDELAISLDKLGVSLRQLEYADVASDTLLVLKPFVKNKPRSAGRWFRWLFWPALVAVLFTAGAGAIRVSEMEAKLARVNAQILDARTIVANGEVLGDRRGERPAANPALSLRQPGHVTILSVLENLAAHLPNPASLTSIEVEDGKLRVSGKTANSTGLLEALRASELLANVDYAVPTVRMVDHSIELFTIKADLRTGEAQ